jgi:hypothetical protein
MQYTPPLIIFVPVATSSTGEFGKANTDTINVIVGVSLVLCFTPRKNVHIHLLMLELNGL